MKSTKRACYIRSPSCGFARLSTTSATLKMQHLSRKKSCREVGRVSELVRCNKAFQNAFENGSWISGWVDLLITAGKVSAVVPKYERDIGLLPAFVESPIAGNVGRGAL